MTLQLVRLTEQELRLLRLLAQGHTAKTIATSEGLSVNVVNERLRSARRKTGAVSSRELARLVGEQEQNLPQENRNKLFGVEGEPSSDHRSERRPAKGAGSSIVWRSAMVVGVLIAASIAALVTAAPEKTASKAQGLPMPIASDVAAIRHWRVMSSSDRVPTITYLVPSSDSPGASTPTVILSCRSVSIDVRVRGFTPANSWPQPKLKTRIGSVERMGSPEVNATGDKPTLGYAFAIADEVLEPLALGEPISFEFNGATMDVPIIPELMRTQFVERCGALVHPGMRKRGAASDRVY